MHDRGHTVGEVAALASISVRTLHHYDAIGLLMPSGRSAGGYRLYSADDLATLRQILFFKTLGFSLDAIAGIIHDPSFDKREALALQRRMLAERSAQLLRMTDAIDREIDAIEKGVSMDAEEMFDVFGDFDPATYEDEARARWSGTDSYSESARRTVRYGKDDWRAIKSESDALNAELAELLDAGVAPDDSQAMDVVEKCRKLIDDRFYPCSREMHVALGEMYVADARFAENYDKLKPGLAQYVCDAIKANAARSV